MEDKSKKRSKQFTVFSLILVAAVIAAFVIINYIGVLLDAKLSLRADLSRQSVMTLSETSKELIQSLNDDILIYGVYEKSDEDKMISELLRKYDESSEHITCDIINPLTSPTVIKAFDPQNQGITTGSVIVSDRQRTRYKIMTHDDLYLVAQEYGTVGIRAEQAISSAISFIISGKNPRVVLLEGHNEIQPSEISSFISSLASLNYDIRSLNLQTTKVDLSPSSDTLVFISPKTDLSDEEFTTLSAFFSAGGKGLFLMDNIMMDEKTGTANMLPAALPKFSELLLSYDLTLNRDVIVGDSSASIGTRATMLLVNSESHDITKDLTSQGLKPILCESSSIDTPVISSGYIKTTPLLISDSQCHTKMLDSNFTTTAKETGDESGSFVVGALAEGKGKIILVGTSSIASQSNFSKGGNRLFLLSSLSYLTGNELLDIQPKMLIDGGLDLGSSENQVVLIIISIGIIPLSVIVIGIIITIKRKRTKNIRRVS